MTNFNPSSVFTLACIHHHFGSYSAELVITTTVPVMLAAAIWFAWLIRAHALKYDPAQCYQQHVRLFLALCYLTLPSICTVVFSAFECESDFGPSGASFLRADLGTDCNSEHYRFMIIPWAVASILVYPLGVNVMYSIVLYRNRAAIKQGKAPHIAFLHDAYRPGVWYWEPVDSLRRISLSGGLALFHGQSSRVVVSVLLSLLWLVLYYRFAPFARNDDQAVAEMINFEILITTIMLSFHQSLLINEAMIGVLCATVNLLIVPVVAFFQIRHAWRGWQVVKSLEPGSDIGDAFNTMWFMRCWTAGGGMRKLLRNKTAAWLEHALQLTCEDDVACQSILRIAQLPPFEDTESFGEDGMGIVLEHLVEGVPTFAVLKPLPSVFEERGRSTHGPASSSISSGNQPLLRIDVQQQPELFLNARLEFASARRRGMDVHHAPRQFIVETREGRRFPFETVQHYALQQLVEKGHVRSVLDHQSDSNRKSCYAAEYPVHFLVQSQLINVPLFAALITEAGPMALLQRDDSDKDVFHFLEYRIGNDNERAARTGDAIAVLIIGAAEAEPSLVQFLLQQSAEHAFVIASRRLIEECGGQIDEASNFDPRTPRAIGRDAHDVTTRAFYDNRDELQEIALDDQRRELENAQQRLVAEKQRELLAVFEHKDEEKRVALEQRRCGIFSETMVSCVPWNLPPRELQEWLIKHVSPNQKKLRTLIDRMGDVSGLTVLLEWVEVGGTHQGKPNFGKLTVQSIARTIDGFKDTVAATQLTNLLDMQNLSYHHAILLSCERRSALTDFEWIKKIGQGGFGVAHLCRNRFSGVIKLVTPDGGDEGMRRDVKETALHQKLAVSEFIAKIFSWGVAGGARFMAPRHLTRLFTNRCSLPR